MDLFWKYIKRYLHEDMKLTVDFNVPKSVIRTACNAKILSEQDAEICLKMIDDRNTSSHLYKEEMADIIGKNIAGYYELIKSYVDKLTP